MSTWKSKVPSRMNMLEDEDAEGELPPGFFLLDEAEQQQVLAVYRRAWQRCTAVVQLDATP